MWIWLCMRCDQKIRQKCRFGRNHYNERLPWIHLRMLPLVSSACIALLLTLFLFLKHFWRTFVMSDFTCVVVAASVFWIDSKILRSFWLWTKDRNVTQPDLMGRWRRTCIVFLGSSLPTGQNWARTFTTVFLIIPHKNTKQFQNCWESCNKNVASVLGTREYFEGY